MQENFFVTEQNFQPSRMTNPLLTPGARARASFRSVNNPGPETTGGAGSRLPELPGRHCRDGPCASPAPRQKLTSRLRLGAWLWVWLLVFAPRPAQGSLPTAFYQVDLRDPASHLVRVTMRVSGTQPATEIQFPAWNNLYQIRDFVRNVQDLGAECDGKRQELERVDLNTWRTGPQACSNLTVRYAVYANEESPFSSVLSTEHAFLNFALLLFYFPRERERQVSVRFLVPAGWKIATLLEDGDTPEEFRAANYDALADSPAEAGEFREYSYTQNGATYRVVVHADPGDYPADRLLDSLKKITATETALMGDVPFSRYTFILHFPRAGGGGGMEHRNGTAISVPARQVREHWEGLEATAAHEFFHLWNVKRIRPQALEPIDYVHGNDTRDLWFAEGVTSTYGELSLLRAGLITREQFYARLAREIQNLQERPARGFQSAELSGREAWLEKYSDYSRPERSMSYYNKGALLGFVLDLAIRQASRNQASLDDVMRRLNTDFARRGRFFTLGDLHSIIAELAPSFTGLEAFLDDFVRGTRELDYETHLDYAGLRLVTETQARPALGFLATRNFDGLIQVESVEPDSHAQKAGLERGDVLLKMNGRTLNEPPVYHLSRMKPGEKVKFRVRREGQTREVEYALGARQESIYRVEELPRASREQLAVRQGWLEGITTRAAGARNP
jgi:predicted metalloprotease with PDZ domain